MTAELRERVARALYAAEVERIAHYPSFRPLPFEDAPEHYTDLSYRQADAVLAVLAPDEQDVESLATTLAELLYDRGDDVRDWPVDEAVAYREGRADGGILAGAEAARKVMFAKAARTLLTSGTVAG